MNDRDRPTTFLGSLRQNWWVWVAAALALGKLALLRAQPIWAIGGAVHDDVLFLRLARFIAHGEWLGPYDQFTLAKGAVYPAFVAANHYLGLPLRLTEQVLYLAACALVVRALAPVVRAGWARLLIFATLAWNPMSFEGEHLTRILRQHLTVPLSLVIAAAGLALVLRRDRGFVARLPWALLGGLALGLFWNTREEGAWILPMTALLTLTALTPLVTGPGRARLAALGLALAAAAVAVLPTLTISALNERAYGWRGTNEFHGREFQDAYGALARVQVGPVYQQVVVSREAREAIYGVSPAFAELRPFLEGEIGLKWADGERFRREERQIGSGWFMWALRDAVIAAGHGRSAGDAMAFYDRLAQEVNAACDAGKLPALSRRSGYFPRWQPAYTTAALHGGWRYLSDMLDFSRFETHAPLSVGTDDDVRLFRDITHDRISPSVNATFIELPEQRRLHAVKLDLMRDYARGLGGALRVALVLAHLALLLRFGQLLRERRLPVTFVLTLAAWGGAAAELALNILVHTTSMPNFYPAAYAPAFPLLLLFLVLLVVDVGAEWRATLGRGYGRARDFLARHPQATWIGGVSLVVFAARLRLIALYGGDVPFLDQWRVEVQEILAPWLRGELTPAAFFTPHHEHLPLWTRLLVWLQAVLTGAYDPRWQMVLNAALHATWIALLCGWVRRQFNAIPAMIVTALALAVSALPHVWENSAWGFQSQFPLALLALCFFVRGACENAPGTRGWWLAQGVGAAGLFTLGSFWTAPLALALVNLWTTPRAVRAWLAPLGLAAVGAALLAVAMRSQPAAGTALLRAGELREFLHVWFYNLGWPVAQPGAAVLLQLPLLVFALRLRRAESASVLDRALLVLGLWSAAQAAGLAFARGGGGADFVSRYGDLAAVGVLANGAILLRLLRGSRWWALPTLGWLVLVGHGLFLLNTVGHTPYFAEHGAARAQFRHEAVSDYVLRHDAAKLRSDDGRRLIYPEPEVVLRQLDDARFVALLPASVRGDAASGAARQVAGAWGWLLAAGVVLLVASARQISPVKTAAPAQGASALGPWALITVGASATFFLWPRPLAWDQAERTENLLYPPTELRELSFEFATKTDYPADRVWGAAALWPERVRNTFVGTHVDGPGFIGGVRSQSFTVASPWLVVPIAGFPASGANALGLIIEPGAHGEPLATLNCAEPVPRPIGFWTLDLRAYAGRRAHFELRDSRADDEGWLAMAMPQPATSADAGRRLDSAWRAERSLPARYTLVGLAGLGLLGVAGSALALRRRSAA